MSRFSELPAHIEAHIGPVRGADSRETAQRERGYHLVYCDHHDGKQVSILTSGLRESAAGAPLPQELVCTLHTSQEQYARHLTGVIADLLLESSSRVGYGALIMNDRSLLPDTEICGALAARHPLFGEDFDTLSDAGGNPALNLITLIPITRAEAQLVARFGRDILYDRWREQHSDLLSVYRPPVA